MIAEHLTKEDILAIKRLLLSASGLMEDAACRAGGNRDLQKRLRDIGARVSHELVLLDLAMPAVKWPAAARAS